VPTASRQTLQICRSPVDPAPLVTASWLIVSVDADDEPHEALLAPRERQTTAAWQAQYAVRAGIEGTLCGQEPNDMRLGKAPRGSYRQFRDLPFNNFTDLTLLRA
jgi:hypothetical protein